MEIVIISILSIIVAGTALVLARKLYKLSKEIRETRNEIELQRYYKKVAGIVTEHVGIQQLGQISLKAEQAVQKAQHLDGFGQYVRPVLQYIIDSTKQLAEGNLPEEERQRLGQSIGFNSAKLTNLIENVLLMARIDSDNVTCNMQMHSVEDIVMPVFEKFRTSDLDTYREVENKGEVVLSIGKGIPMNISCDDVHLTKALTEVVQNACQYIEQGNIQMGWFYKMMTNEVEIFVEDNGIGIKDENQQRIFEPFFKANASYSGLGIGLTIARSLIEKMGGKINVTSRGDFGTRMSIVFQRVK